MKVEYFRSKKKTHRFNANQKVWIRLNCANHLYVLFKWRGSGRYVSGILDKFSNCVGEIKEIEVEESFARRIYDNIMPNQDEYVQQVVADAEVKRRMEKR